MDKKLKPILIKTGVLLLLSLLVFLFGLFPNLVLKYYSTAIYPYISYGLRFISSIFPFALGDIIYVALVGFVLYKIFSFLKNRKRLITADKLIVPIQVLNFFLILYLIFKLIWGLNYSRPQVNEELKISNEKYSIEQLVALGKYFVDKTNFYKLQVKKSSNYDLKTLSKKSIEAYDIMAKQNEVFAYPNPSIKAVTSVYLTSKAGIEGYYAPLSGEANINIALPNFVKPYVVCHEIAHQLGIAYEDEANLFGYLTASNSPDLNFKYSANYEMLRYILLEIALKSPEDYKYLKAQLCDEVLYDFKVEKEFWRQYNGEMFKYMDSTFDRFLKLNNQKKGVNSYQDIVIWLWNIHKSEVGSPSSEDKAFSISNQ
jgi:hypothetical protein